MLAGSMLVYERTLFERNDSNGMLLIFVEKITYSLMIFKDYERLIHEKMIWVINDDMNSLLIKILACQRLESL